MKPLALAVTTLAVTAVAAYGAASWLRISPAQPRPGATLTVTYDPKGGPLEKAETLTLVYGFDEWRIDRARLESRGDRFETEVRIPAEAAYFWCRVEGRTEQESDTNRGGVWGTYLYTEKGLPVEGARRIRAALYQFGKLPLDKNSMALILLEEEVRAFPTSARARSAWWMARYKDSGETIRQRDEILGEIRQLYESHPDQPWAYEAAALGYNFLNRNAQAVDVMRAFVKRLPGDVSLDDRILFYFGNWGTAADLEALPSGSRRWVEKASYWESLVRVYDRTHAGPERLLHAGREWLKRSPIERDTGGEVRVRLAETWLANGVEPGAVEGVAREAVAISELGPRPSLSLIADSAALKKMAKGSIVDVHRSPLGWALFQQGKYADALREFQRAVAIREKEKVTASALYYRLGRTLEKLGRPAEAMHAYMKELAWGAFEKPTRAAVIDLYRNIHGRVEGLETEIRTRVNELRTKTDEAAEPIEDVNTELGRFDLPGPDGQPVQINRYRGKVVLIEFWATWCGSCLKSMEHTQKLNQTYPGQIVVLAVSQDPEETRPRATEYLQKKGYDFVLLFDDERRRDIQLDFVPVRLLLDRNGRLRVREFGWQPSQEPVFEKKLRALLEARAADPQR